MSFLFGSSKKPAPPSKEEVSPTVIKAEHIARILNTDKLLLNNMSDLCFRRCIASFEKEFLNHMEQNCVDRCVSKYDQMVREVITAPLNQ
ncbi:hypothetical protein FGO68_gene4899 [Halteria grandinella]|uniref:Mitochondrial import inner membrane translocase subunit n=1 Tax=Halteria grandinella TaxID=5974 RepID=A0A8J8P3D4_HALGN|nr:hypothetical protein FGO68_gene4899 [Halteria grandinella]